MTARGLLRTWRFDSTTSGYNGPMTPVRIRPLGGAMGCLMMIAVSIVASVLLTVLLNIGR